MADAVLLPVASRVFSIGEWDWQAWVQEERLCLFADLGNEQIDGG